MRPKADPPPGQLGEAGHQQPNIQHGSLNLKLEDITHCTRVIVTQSRVFNSVIFNVHLQYLYLFKVEPQLEIVVMELASETPLVAVLRLPIDDLEGDVFIGPVYYLFRDLLFPLQ